VRLDDILTTPRKKEVRYFSGLVPVPPQVVNVLAKVAMTVPAGGFGLVIRTLNEQHLGEYGSQVQDLWLSAVRMAKHVRSTPTSPGKLPSALSAYGPSTLAEAVAREANEWMQQGERSLDTFVSTVPVHGPPLTWQELSREFSLQHKPGITYAMDLVLNWAQSRPEFWVDPQQGTIHRRLDIQQNNEQVALNYRNRRVELWNMSLEEVEAIANEMRIRIPSFATQRSHRYDYTITDFKGDLIDAIVGQEFPAVP